MCLKLFSQLYKDWRKIKKKLLGTAFMAHLFVQLPVCQSHPCSAQTDSLRNEISKQKMICANLLRPWRVIRTCQCHDLQAASQNDPLGKKCVSPQWDTSVSKTIDIANKSKEDANPVYTCYNQKYIEKQLLTGVSSL